MLTTLSHQVGKEGAGLINDFIIFSKYVSKPALLHTPEDIDHNISVVCSNMTSDNTWGGLDVAEDVVEKKEESKDVIVTEEDLLRWSTRSLMKAGAEKEPARIMSNILLSADKRGHYSHGFNRLDIYYNDIAK